jgi:hypothetical protein
MSKKTPVTTTMTDSHVPKLTGGKGNVIGHNMAKCVDHPADYGKHDIPCVFGINLGEKQAPAKSVNPAFGSPVGVNTPPKQ